MKVPPSLPKTTPAPGNIEMGERERYKKLKKVLERAKSFVTN